MEERANQWIEKHDPNSDKIYWGNIVTKTTTWIEPDEVKHWRESTVRELFWECVDEKSQRSYFINQDSGKSTWLKPSGTIQRRHARSLYQDLRKSTDTNDGTAAAASSSSQSQPTVQNEITAPGLQSGQSNAVGNSTGPGDTGLPHGWVSCSDPRTKKTYYYNRNSGETTWEKPTSTNAMRGENTQLLIDSSGATSASGIDSEVTIDRTGSNSANESEGWESAMDVKTNKIYYVNRTTRQSTWERPASFGNVSEMRNKIKIGNAPENSTSTMRASRDTGEHGGVSLRKSVEKKGFMKGVRDVFNKSTPSAHIITTMTTLASSASMEPLELTESTQEECIKQQSHNEKRKSYTSGRTSAILKQSTKERRRAAAGIGTVNESNNRNTTSSANSKVIGATAVLHANGSVRGAMLKLSNRSGVGFQSRYCVLQDRYLFYFKTQHKFLKKAEPNGHVDLRAASQVRLSADAALSNGVYVIELVTKDRDWKFGVKTVQDLQLWLEGLQLASQMSEGGVENNNGVSGEEPEGRTRAMEIVMEPESLPQQHHQQKNDNGNSTLVETIFETTHGGTVEDIVHNFYTGNPHFSRHSSLDDQDPNRAHVLSSFHSHGLPESTFKLRNASISSSMAYNTYESERSPSVYSGVDRLVLEQIPGITNCTSVPTSVDAWLEQEQLGDLKEGFVSAGYDEVKVLVGLSDGDVKAMLQHEIGLEKPGQRMKVVVALRQLRVLWIEAHATVERQGSENGDVSGRREKMEEKETSLLGC